MPFNRCRFLMLTLVAMIGMVLHTSAPLSADDDDKDPAPPTISVGATPLKAGDAWTETTTWKDKWDRSGGSSRSFELKTARGGKVTSFVVEYPADNAGSKGRFEVQSGSRGFRVTSGDPAVVVQFPKDTLEKVGRDVFVFDHEHGTDVRPSLAVLVNTCDMWLGNSLRAMLGKAEKLTVGDSIAIDDDAIPAGLLPGYGANEMVMMEHSVTGGSRLVTFVSSRFQNGKLKLQSAEPVGETPAVTFLLTYEAADYNAEKRVDKAWKAAEMENREQPPGGMAPGISKDDLMKQMGDVYYYSATITLATATGLPIRLVAEKRPTADEIDPWVTITTDWVR